MRILLVEDDELLGDGVKAGLSRYGYTVDWSKEGRSAEHAIRSEHFDLVVLDLGLPKRDGIQVLYNIRDAGISTPVLILTARESADDMIKGLDAGADDYLTKPFDLEVLSARVRALLRRSSGRADSQIHYRNISIDPASHSVLLEGQGINLPRREFSLLVKLLENPGHVLSREQLMQSIYGWEEDVDSNTLEVHVHNLRKKLNANWIRTIRGVGYMVEKS